MESKADDKYPVVSAASICAKVTRDHDLRDFAFAEKPKEPFSRTFGCGYPGDAVTVKWLKEHSDEVFGFPSIVRFSWKTAYVMMQDQGKKIEWHDANADEGGSYKMQQERERAKKEREAMERNRLTQAEKDRKMNQATFRLGLQRGFDEF